MQKFDYGQTWQSYPKIDWLWNFHKQIAGFTRMYTISVKDKASSTPSQLPCQPVSPFGQSDHFQKTTERMKAVHTQNCWQKSKSHVS
jgi:hypothetical protein